MREKVCNILVCPKCKNKLSLKGSLVYCCENHSYDVAKSGYLNLLLANQKKSKSPGDDRVMLISREQFLSKGYFDILCQKIYEELKKIQGEILIVDAGCGTGYYLRTISNMLQSYGNVGVDIAKDGVELASKKDKENTYIVSSIFDMPIKNESADVILNIFAPKPQSEFKRILKPSGIIVEVVPGHDHLKEVKEIVYENVKDNAERFAFDLPLKSSTHITYKKVLEESCDAVNLFKMTPYFHKTSEQNMSKLENKMNILVTFDFILNIWQK